MFRAYDQILLVALKLFEQSYCWWKVQFGFSLL